MSKFQVGEIAILVSSGGAGLAGQEVTILAVGPFEAGYATFVNGRPCGTAFGSDYLIDGTDGSGWFAKERSLRKRPQPRIPQSVLEIFRLPVEIEA